MTIWLALAWTLAAASFDCAKAVHPVEKTICSDPALSALDDSLGRSWKRTLAAFGVDDQSGLRREQRAWMDELRRGSNDAAPLREAWGWRLRELDLKRATTDLRAVVSKTTSPGGIALERWGSCGRMDFETGEPVEGAAMDLLEWAPGREPGLFRFRLVSGIDQPQCHSCEVEGEVRRGRKGVWIWSGANGEGSSSGELRFFADSVVVDVLAFRQEELCGIGASLAGSFVFHRSGLRLPRP